MTKRIFVAGHQGMVGSAILRELAKQSDINILSIPRSKLDLTDPIAVQTYMELHKPNEVYLAAAKVGGIYANNSYPAEFIADNLAIQSNVIRAAHLAGVRKLLFLGSSCIYPKLAKQPIREDYLLTGALEPTNEPYAIAKIAGIKMCESFNRQYDVDYRCVMPTNLYGENDNFHPKNSHVIPAMMRRFHEAKSSCSEKVSVWGTGKPMREFLYVDDMAAACVYVMGLTRNELMAAIPNPMCSHINVGSGREITIAELAVIMAKVVGFEGRIEFDNSKPDGSPRKLMDIGRLSSLGWKSTISLIDGSNRTYLWYKKNILSVREV